VLNLYAGIGGNRKFWNGCHVTAVERDVHVAAAYKYLYPEDTLIVGDAHQYLLKNYQNFDFIWSSPPCQSHSRMNYWLPAHKKIYVDLSLYQQVIFLREFFRGSWVVENVNPYYLPLVAPDKRIGRHCFWTNFSISDFEIEQIPGFINLDTPEDKESIMKWLGIRYDKNIYLSGKSYLQVFRNCVHPDIGLSIFNDFITSRRF
jgi:DNA (cytosine-5)-methyltransferase 1